MSTQEYGEDQNIRLANRSNKKLFTIKEYVDEFYPEIVDWVESEEEAYREFDKNFEHVKISTTYDVSSKRHLNVYEKHFLDHKFKV